MKQIEYNEKQKEIIEILEPFWELIKYKLMNRGDIQEVKQVVKNIEKKYGIQRKYQTLREYMNEHAIGAYHSFIFKIGKVEVNVIGVSDFELYYNSKWLDRFFVIEDIQNDNGGNCENYECKHYLKIAEVERE